MPSRGHKCDVLHCHLLIFCCFSSSISFSRHLLTNLFDIPQVAQYLILIIAYLLPSMWLGVKEQGSPVPQITYGCVTSSFNFGSLLISLSFLFLFLFLFFTTKRYILESVNEMEKKVQSDYTHQPDDFHYYLEIGSQFNFWALTVCLMVGTASLPHVLMRYFTTPSVRAARKSVAYSLLFVFFLYITAPCYATFTKYEVLKNVIGMPLGSLPEWIYIYGNIGMVQICDANAISPAVIIESCTGKYPADHVTNQSLLFYEDFQIDKDAVVMASPEISDQPYIIAALISAGKKFPFQSPSLIGFICFKVVLRRHSPQPMAFSLPLQIRCHTIFTSRSLIQMPRRRSE